MKLLKRIKILLIILLSLIILTLGGIITYQYMIGPVNSSKEIKEITIASGTNINTIAKILKENNLIRSEKIFIWYVKIKNKDNLKASTYALSSLMSMTEIIDILTKGNSYNPNQVTITFKEGINIRQIATIISENTNNTKEEVIAKTNDQEYLKELIEKYWFIDESILNKDIYYKLEGYLFPDTYIYENKDVSIETIFKKMLDEMDNKISPLKDSIETSPYSIHQLLTLSSIVELEGVSGSDRGMIAGVFYNRLNNKDRLGSDVTACYAFKIDIKSCNDNVPYTKYNPYNTRSTEMSGKLPIGPICSPSIESIKGAIIPTTHDYYYFVADKNKKVYFMKTYQEFQSQIKEIKERGEWPW